jgi:hypothetical protein
MQWFPTFFCSRTPKQEKENSRTSLQRVFFGIFINILKPLAYPFRFLTYPWEYAHPRLGTALMQTVLWIMHEKNELTSFVVWIIALKFGQSVITN